MTFCGAVVEIQLLLTMILSTASRILSTFASESPLILQSVCRQKGYLFRQKFEVDLVKSTSAI